MSEVNLHSQKKKTMSECHYCGSLVDNDVPLYVFSTVDNHRFAKRKLCGISTQDLAPSPRVAKQMQVQETQNQSMLVLGENGASKIVSAKNVTKYLATVSQVENKGKPKQSFAIELKTLHSNLTLESFDNTRTLRSNNYPRFR